MSRPEIGPRVEPDEAGLRDRLSAAARSVWPGAEISGLRRLSGGASGLTYRVELVGAPETAAIVKVAPAGLNPTRHRDVRRQARVLDALSGVDGVPVPRVLFTDGAAPAIVAMTVCPGEACEPNIDDVAPQASADEVRGRAIAAAEVLARVHQAPVRQVIAGEPETSLAEEVARWDRAFATLPAEFGLDWTVPSRGLRDTMPATVPAALTHGDYRLGNLLCVATNVVAVIDWEIWAVGDRRTDLGWYLLSLDAQRHPAAVRAANGVPPRAELLDRYAAAGGGSIERAEWFLGLALYKFAATTGLIAKHAVRRGERDSWGARMVPRLPGALRHAADLATAGGWASM